MTRTPRILWLFGILAALGPWAQLSTAGTNSLLYRPIAAEYSDPLDRIITISAGPNQLHIYDPITQADTAVSLVKAPLCLSVGPDGLYAAVGHDAFISYVNLATATVEKTIPVPVIASGITLASSWVYVLGGPYGSSVSVDLSTSSVSTRGVTFSGTYVRLNRPMNALYGTRDGTSPNDIEKYDISTGPITAQTDSVYHGDYNVCGPVWFSPDGQRIYSGCATVFRASTDKALDMYYATTIEGVTSVGAFSESASLRKFALIQKDGSTSYPASVRDDYVALYNSDYLTPAGRFALPSFNVNGNIYRPHGKWAFFNRSGDRLFVIIQADPGSGMLNDFAVYTIPMGEPAGDCDASFGSAAANAPAAGRSGTVAVTTATDCFYRATSGAPWIELVSGAYGAGNGTLIYLVRPNDGSGSRTGTISLGARILTITQEGDASPTEMALLGYGVVDATYSKSLERIVSVSSGPNELHLYDPVARTDRHVSLVKTPLSVSVRPDGLYAMVGHDGWISYINLQNLAVEKVLQVITDVRRLVLAGNGYAYLFPARSWSDMYSLEVATWKLSATSAIYDGRVPRLDATGNYLYVGGDSFSKWNISQGVATKVSEPFGLSSCGDLWPNEDGRRLVTACGKLYTTSEVREMDLQYNGTLNALGGVIWSAHSFRRQLIAAIPNPSSSLSSGAKAGDASVQFYSDAYLEYEGAAPLPDFTWNGTTFAAHGKFAFWDSASSYLYVVAQADSTAATPAPFGVAAISPASAFQVAVNSIVNAASLAPGAIAPGEMIVISGQLMGGPVLSTPSTGGATRLSQTEVYVGGQAAAILYASPTQVIAGVPTSSYVSGQQSLQVVNHGIVSAATTVTFAVAAPGVFTMNGSGSGQAVARNQNGSLNSASNGAVAGSTVSVFITGGGATLGSGPAGTINTYARNLSQTVTASVGGVAATVVQARSAVGMMEGVAQIDLRLAATTPAGDQPIVITVGGINSPATATLAVKASAAALTVSGAPSRRIQSRRSSEVVER